MTAAARRAALKAGAALGFWSALGGLLGGLLGPAPAAAQDYSNFLVFGDSLVDTGQRIDPGLVYPGFPVALPADARWRYTNRVVGGEYGQPYSGRLSETLGFGTLYPSTPQTAPGLTAEGVGLNYGVGGARAAEVRAQIETLVTVPGTPFYPATTTGPGFLVGPNAGLARGSLALVSAGGNDVRDMANLVQDADGDPALRLVGEDTKLSSPDLPALLASVQADPNAFALRIGGAMGAAAQETAAGVRALRRAGVDLVILPNVPNLADTPESAYLNGALPGADFSAIRDGASEAYNAALRQNLARESGVMFVDLDGFFAAVLADPGAFGFGPEDQSGACYNASEFTGVPCDESMDFGFNLGIPSPNALLFNDGIHPTTAGHAAMADLVAAQLSAGTQVSLAPHLPLGAARSLTAAFEDAAERGARLGGVSAFGGLGGTTAEYDAGGDSRGFSGQIGATKALTPEATVGVGFGYRAMSAEASGADFDGSAYLGGVFGRYDDGRFFGSATLAAGYADLDVERGARIGAARLKTEGSADGWVIGGAVQAGARLLEAPGFTAGPLARLESWSSSLGGYAEEGPSYLAQRFDDLDARSFRGGIGAFAEARGESVGARVEALYEHEFADARDIRVSSGSLGGAGWTARGRAAEDDGFKIGLTTFFDAGRLGVVSAGYAGRLGDDQSHDFRLGLSMPF